MASCGAIVHTVRSRDRIISEVFEIDGQCPGEPAQGSQGSQGSAVRPVPRD